MSLNNFHYIYQDQNASEVLVLLHGTGGDEYDLLPLAKHINKTYNILSIRGNISENGMNRFFSRIEFGVFDEKSIAEEAKKLTEFIDSFISEHSIALNDLTFLGFSNGANMILALLLLYPNYIQNAVLLHPMLPLKPGKLDLTDKQVAVAYGEQDTMISSDQSREVIQVLEEKGATVSVFSHSGGHEITMEELSFVSSYLNSEEV